ncbi:MAG: acetylpolyamine amidohydrolase [Candidatus Muirbacterium halophilum]|nr:acetylpolyamine amidohydrolase [Candidatus Muirbacterium halophilum]MCK9476456.1 acetylpolyamine amidohydrolase [Candidatus Muirbacterium halophilum]
MFRIRKFFDSINNSNKRNIQQIKTILKERFPLLDDDYLNNFSKMLDNPVSKKFRTIIFIADNMNSKLKGFAILLHFSDLNFYYLDFIASNSNFSGRGIGAALYQRIREEAYSANVTGIFMECLPDDPALCKDPVILKENISRLKFYEKFNVRPIINTAYETPVKTGDDNPPYLLLDNLSKQENIYKDYFKKVVTAILKRKYHDVVDQNYINTVVNSIKDETVQLRPLKYLKKEVHYSFSSEISNDEKIPYVFNHEHNLHHIHERGYVEKPLRLDSILKTINKSSLFLEYPAKKCSEALIKEVHSKEFFNYIKTVCENISEKNNIYPYVFPLRNRTKPPIELTVRAGYYCIDTFTPLNKHVFSTAKKAVDCAYTGAELLTDNRLVYSLVRPPGHHSGINTYGGFCYFNSAAIAAQFLSKKGKVCMLDIDYHHGNGQQDIFYKRDDVLTISIHGHPRFAYPYFSGFAEEKGEDNGVDFNHNFPLPEKITFEKYIETLKKSIKIIENSDTEYLIICFGADTSKGDPTGTWDFEKKDYEVLGKLIGNMNLPTLVVQEGGYSTKKIGNIVLYFLSGLWKSIYNK